MTSTGGALSGMQAGGYPGGGVGEAGATGCGWRTREASQGGVRGLETAEAEESRGLGIVGILELGRELENPGRNKEET